MALARVRGVLARMNTIKMNEHNQDESYSTAQSGSKCEYVVMHANAVTPPLSRYPKAATPIASAESSIGLQPGLLGFLARKARVSLMTQQHLDEK